jgi:hypothetical protein
MAAGERVVFSGGEARGGGGTVARVRGTVEARGVFGRAFGLWCGVLGIFIWPCFLLCKRCSEPSDADRAVVTTTTTMFSKFFAFKPSSPTSVYFRVTPRSHNLPNPNAHWELLHVKVY